ncbi:unnamed protein product [Rhizophagus irregularis]|nr:unnamed protein product [Rhizophagus irregularis]
MWITGQVCRSTCEKQDIKHVGVCGSSANFPQKTFPEKITQNKKTKYGQYYSQLPYNSHRNLHAQIQQQLPQQFRNVPFYLRALRPGLVNYVAMRQGGLISNYFDENLTGVYHVLIEDDVYGYYDL